MAEWTADANEALTISLVRSEKDNLKGEDSNVVQFHPAFTYPVRRLHRAQACVVLNPDML